MKNLHFRWLYSLLVLLFSLTAGGCDYDDEDVMNPSSWAAILVIAAIALFFYYLFKMYRNRKR